MLDNLFDSDILSLCEETNDPDELAYLIAWKAQQVALKAKGPRATPFAVHAAEHGRRFDGGKLDDITVVVAIIRPNSPLSKL